jgi:hypothetical protein
MEAFILAEGPGTEQAEDTERAHMVLRTTQVQPRRQALAAISPFSIP